MKTVFCQIKVDLDEEGDFTQNVVLEPTDRFFTDLTVYEGACMLKRPTSTLKGHFLNTRIIAPIPSTLSIG